MAVRARTGAAPGAVSVVEAITSTLSASIEAETRGCHFRGVEARKLRDPQPTHEDNLERGTSAFPRSGVLELRPKKPPTARPPSGRSMASVREVPATGHLLVTVQSPTAQTSRGTG